MSKLNYTNQHFLINPDIAEAMVGLANIDSDDYVLEIGPGRGIITRLLLKYAKKVIAIEKDLGMQNALNKLQDGYSNLEIIIGDALTRRWPKKINKLVANIPFNITEPLLDKMIIEKINLSCLLVGEGYASTVDSYKRGDTNTPSPSRLAFLTNAYFIPEIQMGVPSKNFYPEPSVDGAIITLESIKKQNLAKRSFSLYVLRSIWDQNTRRVYDSLFNGVANFLSANGKTCYLSRDQLYRFIEVDPSILQKRSSALTNQDFLQIYQSLEKKRFKKRLFRSNKNLEEMADIEWN